VALRLLDGDERIAQALANGELGELSQTAPHPSNPLSPNPLSPTPSDALRHHSLHLPDEL
jgi:hypothetical protein